MKNKFKGDELVLAEMLFETVFRLNGMQFPENAKIVRGKDIICATCDTEEIFIDLKQKAVFKSSYTRVDLLNNAELAPEPDDEELVIEEPAAEEITTEKPAVEEPVIEEIATEENVPIPLPLSNEIPEDFSEAEEAENALSPAEKLFPSARQEILTKIQLLRQVAKYSEESTGLYINPDGKVCFPNNFDSDCVGHIFVSDLPEEDRDELLDLIYSDLQKTEKIEVLPSDALIVHL